MTALHRHQLVRLTDEGWRSVLQQPWDASARACLAYWSTHRLPLVVTQQPPSGSASDHHRTGATLALGLAAPLCWQRRRIALCVLQRHVAWFDEFPRAEEIAPLLPPPTRPAWRALCASLAALGARARVYGSHGWQHASGLAYLRAGSDVDLWTAVADDDQADAVVALLQGFGDAHARRLDGELLFPDGRAVAWREWQPWRSGRTLAILCKTLQGAALQWADARTSSVWPTAATEAVS
jgi:phosphoribosyl-dephospho-CoA transferase